MITVTLIRHGESIDNLKSNWAGWKDSTLSNHGMSQAQALGDFFSNVKFTAIHASPLKRAFMTAQALQAAQPSPHPALSVSPLLREQHFGAAEGQPWSIRMIPNMTPEEHFRQGIWPVLPGRDQKFPDGESLDDLRDRAHQVVEQIVMPYVWESARGGPQDVRVALVSHGLCIGELVAALMEKDAGARSAEGKKWFGLLNTAWTRVAIDITGLQDGKLSELKPGELPPITVRVTDVNRHEHLEQLKRQPGGIGSAAHDPKQKDIRSFFGGGRTSDATEEGRSTSNMFDEKDI